MSDMTTVITPRSDQLNSDDLIAGPMTIEITGVTIRPGQEQPISISYVGDKGKPYKACKSMCRCMVNAWGADSKKYIGRSLTLYRDPAVKWGGLAVGGIRISHMSDIDSALTMALTETRASRKPFTVRPLLAPKESAASHGSDGATGSVATKIAANPAPAADLITKDQIATLTTRCADNGIALDDLKAAGKIEQLADMLADRYAGAVKWLDKRIAERQQAQA
jgi:hypothetical protein